MVESKVIGVMHMLDEQAADDKIIAVAKNDMSVNYINGISNLPPQTTAATVVKIHHFRCCECRH